MSNKNSSKQEIKPDKLTYEQLENIAHQLSEQSRVLSQKLQAQDLSNVFKRLDYLFLIISNSASFPKDYVYNCVIEIQTLMEIPKEETSTEEVGEDLNKTKE